MNHVFWCLSGLLTLPTTMCERHKMGQCSAIYIWCSSCYHVQGAQRTLRVLPISSWIDRGEIIQLNQNKAVLSVFYLYPSETTLTAKGRNLDGHQYLKLHLTRQSNGDSQFHNPLSPLKEVNICSKLLCMYCFGVFLQ